MDRVRILFTIPNFLTAGSGREMFNIIERLDREIFEPFIAVNEPGGHLYEEILQKGYTVIVGKFHVEESASIPKKLGSVIRLSKKFRPFKFNIWQSFNWSSDYTEALIARFAGARYVYVKKNMNWDRLAWKVKSRLSTAIVARNSTLISGQLATNSLRGKTFFVPGGVSTECKSAIEFDIRTQLGIPANATLISCVAQLVKVKDQATLVSAVGQISNVYLVLAGAERDIEYTSRLKKLISDNRLDDRVLLIGNVSNVRELLNASDVFVLPTTDRDSHEEGCPVALLEAMAAGVPCIASNVAGSRDLIIANQTGLLFTPGDSAELADCIRCYLANPNNAKQLAGNAQRMVEEDYTLEKEASAFANMYRKILKA